MLELLSLNPLSPDTRPLDWLAPWTPMLSGGQLAGVYDRAFFPELHRVLHIWLTHKGVIYDEVWAWLEATKRTHLPTAAADDPRVLHHASAAFSAIHSAQHGLPIPAGYPVVGSAAAASMSIAGGGGSRAAAMALAEAEREVERKSVKEFVAEAAAAAGLTWAPRAGRQVAGLQVFALGSLSVVVDVHAGVVKAFMGDRWVPMAIDDVIQQALKKG
jgi:hypothetical protein